MAPNIVLYVKAIFDSFPCLLAYAYRKNFGRRSRRRIVFASFNDFNQVFDLNVEESNVSNQLINQC